MTIDAAVLIGEGPDSLEGTKVTTPAGTDLFREGVVISDPDNAQGRANVKTLGTQLSTVDKGLVVNAIIHGETTGAGGGYRDVKVNPSGALVTDATGSTVALDAASLAALETINVGNFPTTQAVSGTVTANLGALNGAATAANQTTGNTTLSSLDNKTPDESGVWGYNAGTSGTLAVAANKRILAITATAGLIAATMTINGGQTINIPINGSLTINPRGNLTAPTIVFTNTTAYFVEFVE